MKYNIKTFEHVLLFLIFNQLVIDTLNGFLLFKFNFDAGVSALYKIVIFLICLIYISLSRNGFISSFFIIIYGIIILLIHSIHSAFSELMMDLSEYIKLVTTFVIFSAVANFTYCNPSKYLKLLSIYSLLIIGVNITFSILGFGKTSYADFGYKGFFYAANALSGVYCIIAGILLYIALNTSWKYYWLTSAILLAFAASIGTKTSIIFVILSITILPILTRQKKSVWSLFALSLAIVCFIIVYLEEILNSSLAERIIHFYEVGGLAKVIFSGRDLFLIDNLSFFANSNVLSVMTGIGFSGINSFIKPLTEIDIVDISVIYGVLSMVIYLITYIFILFYKNDFVNTYAPRKIIKLSRYIGMMLLIISAIAGHILFNGMVTLYLGLILALPHWYANYNYLSKREERNA